MLRGGPWAETPVHLYSAYRTYLNLGDHNNSDGFRCAIPYGPLAITTVLPTTFMMDSLYSIPLTATDAVGGIVTWSVPRKPASMNIVSNTLVWVPTTAGLDTIAIIATDGTWFDTLSSVVQVLATTALMPNLRHSSLTSLSLSATQHVHSMSITAGLPANLPEGTIAVYNLSGRKIAENSISGTGWHTVNVGDVRAGVYLLRLTVQGRTIVQRFSIY